MSGRVSARVVVERLIWAIGVITVAIWAVAYFSGVAGAHREMRRFEALRSAGRLEATASPDQVLWSPERKKAWRETLSQNAAPPLAVLRIRRLGLEVPVLEGTDDWTLNRGAGHIEDTADPGTSGNAGIAGHRDGFFRCLKDIVAGDVLELDTLRGRERYRVERAWIVDPDDVSVLDPTAAQSITLVTCYPFYFIGSAPQRFIVRAVLDGPPASAPGGGVAWQSPEAAHTSAARSNS
jgi:sortase A